MCLCCAHASSDYPAVYSYIACLLKFHSCVRCATFCRSSTSMNERGHYNCVYVVSSSLYVYDAAHFVFPEHKRKRSNYLYFLRWTHHKTSKAGRKNAVYQACIYIYICIPVQKLEILCVLRSYGIVHIIYILQ